MQQGSITHLYLARVKETPSDPVSEATAISGKGLEGDRSCSESNMRQVLFMDQETLAKLELEPGRIKENITTAGLDLSQVEAGQVVFIGDRASGNPVTMEIVGPCEPCQKMDAIRPGLRKILDGQRGMLAIVLNGGAIKVGDAVTVEP